ncbi:MAG: L-amino acid N-acyltransferase YncA [Granulosicoccus sp.]
MGKLLLEQLILACEMGPWRQMIAVIGNSINTGSIALHKKHSFCHVGTIETVGYKLDQ